jgi:uncharacterized membrane protein YdjX (TVP38/TMEM64 family)
MRDPCGPGRAGSGRGGLARYLPLAVLAIAMTAAFALGLQRYLSLETVVAERAELRDFVARHYGYALLLYAAVYVATVALSLPGAAVLTLAGGFLFGWLVGGLATVVAATAGATIVYLAARTSLGAALAEKAGPSLARLAKGFQDDAVSYLLFLRLVPLFPFWLVNLAPALFGVRLWVYVTTTFVGILPGTFAFAIAGAGLDSLVAAQQAAHAACAAAGRAGCEMTLDARMLLTPQIVAGFVALGVLALLPMAIRRFAGKRLPGLDGRGPVS